VGKQNFVYPNLERPNHAENLPEQFLLSVPSLPAGLFIFVVQASLNMPPDVTSGNYTFSVTPNFHTTFFFGLSMFGIIGALTVLVLCLFSAAAVIARRRRALEARGILGLGNEWQMGLEAGERTGASETQIAQLKHYKFQHNSMPEEDARCAICLSDYTEDEELRDLPCGHHFHSTCVDQWLRHKKHCPLCQQNIETARDVASHSTATVTTSLQAYPNQSRNLGPGLTADSFRSKEDEIDETPV